MSFNNEGTETNIKPKYFLKSEKGNFDISNYIGKPLSILFLNKITCISCGKSIKKTYGQGYCYPCFISVPQTEECVLRPELCRAHEGIARDMDYAKQNCLVDQYVYLATSGGLKVGVTRYHQVPYRWVDQGASKAIIIAVTKNRYNAGLIEVALKKILADKTNWRKMLMGNDEDIPLTGEKHKALEYLNNQQAFEYAIPNDIEFRVDYEVNSFPTKVISKSLDKENSINGLLTGIKGQYMIFEGGRVINIRKHTGYHVKIMGE
ncbi:MAG: DUF2797 domain-containing protein [Bacteroidales bacterium]